MPQQPFVPNLETQRAAMRKLGFLIGRWTGEARMAAVRATTLT
jgi:hypothetical protein